MWREALIIGATKKIIVNENAEKPDPRKVDTGLIYHFDALNRNHA
jgi:hypothetical protein